MAISKSTKEVVTTKQEYVDIVAAWASGKDIEVKSIYSPRFVICTKVRPPSYDPHSKYRVYIPPVVEKVLYDVMKDQTIKATEELSKGGYGVELVLEDGVPIRVRLVKSR